ncbi:unnamed protein product [Vitrella brassicaformis CCMP3155]|uniref:PAS domain-containing protein n=1 Tax=Vitrella brassicaformis (strain CCMP3155) TaxID=1169540 RepID=A0A0G4ES35_VITBC|nr:unnamed protein product [Vitrella brassicaformis CCMP3155]|eukprot:CEM00112.1 unnamed protein product [Vitrella brassicaformis CCMP3155]
MLKGISSLEFSTTIADPDLPDCPIVAVSKGFCDLTKFEPWELIGRNCRLLQCDETDRNTTQKIKDYVLRVYRNDSCDEDLIVKLVNKRKTGEIFENLLHISPLRLGRKLYFVGVQCDVTNKGIDPNVANHSDLVVQTAQRVAQGATNDIGVEVSKLVKNSSKYLRTNPKAKKLIRE